MGWDRDPEGCYALPNIKYNLCVLCYHLFYSGVDIANMGDSIKKRLKVLKARKLQNFVLLCCIKFYVTPAQTFWLLWGVYSNKVSIALKIKIEFDANKYLIYI